jgi:hypothetical protein
MCRCNMRSCHAKILITHHTGYSRHTHHRVCTYFQTLSGAYFSNLLSKHVHSFAILLTQHKAQHALHVGRAEQTQLLQQVHSCLT